MSGKKTKLKKINLTSVDMVRRGANQEAFINLYKSAGDPEDSGTPPDTLSAPESNEIPQGLWKSIVDLVKGFMGMDQVPSPMIIPGHGINVEEVEKGAETFEENVTEQDIRKSQSVYHEALIKSIDSILEDDLDDQEKISMMNKSIEQFSEAYKDMCAKLVKATPNTTEAATEQPPAEGETQEDIPDNEEEGEEEMKIDKSRFTAEELAQYEALIAKGLVDEEPETDDEKEEAPVEKSAEMHPEIRKALDAMAEFQKGMEMKEMTGIAKKYTVLGHKEDELAATLYDMKKSSPSSYNAYLAVLDQNLELVNKSGMFEEIGKSGKGVAASGTQAKIASIAKSYQEKDPTLDYDTAVLKAWENNPDLIAECDKEYF